MPAIPSSPDTNHPVDPVFLQSVLVPYRDCCKYLQQAAVEIGPTSDKPRSLVAAIGEFGITESWYIADTGHFNAIEFNLCYNQLAYVLLGQCITAQLFEPLNHWTAAQFSQYQLSNFLIARFSSAFRRPMGARQFYGRVAVVAASRRRNLVMLKTEAEFWTDSGRSEGEVTLAILDAPEYMV